MTTTDSFRVGLLGLDLDLSLSRVLHEEEGRALGLDYRYEVFDARHNPEFSDVRATLGWARAAGYRGVNVTHPFKRTAVAHVDALSPNARALDAVNTVVFDGDSAIGHNTDWYGFAVSIDRNLANVPRQTVLQMGAGGAGVAVAHALLRSGVQKLALLDINEIHAAAVARLLRAAHSDGDVVVAAVDDAGRWLAKADGLVNTTPIGMPARPGSPVPAELLRPEMWVHDIVYMPLETELMRAARAAGCLTVGGGDMLVSQAAKGLELFTGLTPDVARMEAHLHRLIVARNELTGGHERPPHQTGR
jgi:shikimate dehydrogenase